MEHLIHRLRMYILTQEIVEIRERFEEDTGEKSEGDVFDKIIEDRINFERVRSLERKLEEGVEAIDRTAAEVKGHVEELRTAHTEASAKFTEAKEAKDFEKERTRRVIGLSSLILLKLVKVVQQYFAPEMELRILYAIRVFLCRFPLLFVNVAGGTLRPIRRWNSR